MRFINLTIDGKSVSATAGSSVLQAAKRSTIEIPTLCFLEDYNRYTSCMMCVVEDAQSKKLVPSCSLPAAEGMVIETNNERVRQARRDTLELLLSEHVGDCQAPCYRACPAHMDIPLMIRQIHEQRFEDALVTVKQDIALPAVLGRICSAPCEKGCNRRIHDGALSVCALKRFVADEDLDRETPYKPVCRAPTGKRVAIIGSGPAGLSSAYYLQREGHHCDVFDDHDQPGGMLRYGIPDDILPKSVLDAEIDQIRAIGATFEMKRILGKDLSLQQLRQDYDVIVLTLGSTDFSVFQGSGLKIANRGIQINRQTFETDLPGVFAGGNAIAEGKMAIRSSAHGKFIACSVNQLLSNLPVTGPLHRFDAVLGKVRQDEIDAYLQDSSPLLRVIQETGTASKYSMVEAVDESGRCFHCDCRKACSCKLRQYADEYGADQQRYKFTERKPVERILQHGLLSYEPGKCIKCGLCVQITEKSGGQFGFTFVRRGFNMRIAVPFDEALEKGLENVAAECVEACPTAALAWLDREERTAVCSW
jgi:ferredoxin